MTLGFWLLTCRSVIIRYKKVVLFFFRLVHLSGSLQGGVCGLLTVFRHLPVFFCYPLKKNLYPSRGLIYKPLFTQSVRVSDRKVGKQTLVLRDMISAQRAIDHVQHASRPTRLYIPLTRPRCTVPITHSVFHFFSPSEFPSPMRAPSVVTLLASSIVAGQVAERRGSLHVKNTPQFDEMSCRAYNHTDSVQTYRYVRRITILTASQQMTLVEIGAPCVLSEPCWVFHRYSSLNQTLFYLIFYNVLKQPCLGKDQSGILNPQMVKKLNRAIVYLVEQRGAVMILCYSFARSESNNVDKITPHYLKNHLSSLARLT